MNLDRSARSEAFRFLSFISVALLTTAPTFAESAKEDDTDQAQQQGRTIIVTGVREAETGYKVSNTMSATRTDTPLIDTPQSVSVVTARQIEDQAANSIGEAIRYTPGIFSAQGEGNRETLVIRGMTTTGDFFVDGIRDDVQTYRDLYNIQHLQIFRGPNAMTFGRGGTGGLINREIKVADWDAVRELRLEAGMFEHYRGQIDIGQPLSDRIAVRIAGVYQNSDSYRDGVEHERWGINPTAAFRIGSDTLIQLGYEHFNDERIADRGVPSQLRPATSTGATEPLATRRGQFFGDPANSPTDTNTDAANLYISHDFGDGITLRNRTRYADYDKFYQNVFPALLNATTLANTAAATPAPGLPIGAYPAGTIVQIQAYKVTTRRENIINQTDLNAKFKTGSLEHTLLVGAEFGRQETDNIRVEGFFPVPGNPAGVQTIFAPIDASRIDRPDLVWRQIASSGDNFGTLDIMAGYVQDQIAFSSQFELILGIRYEHLVTKVQDRRTVGFPANGQRDFRVADNLWSPRAGIIFKPIENASIYTSYSRSYLPRGGDQLTSLSLTTQSLDPEKYTNWELGAKWDVNPDFNVSAAVYQLDRDNVIVLIDPDNAGAGTELGGGQRSRGVELSVAGNLTPQVSFVGAYTYQDAEFTRAISASVQNGAEIPNAPRHSGSLWARYDVTPTLGFALGASFQGRRFAAQDNLVKLPGYERVDGAVFFRLSDRFDVQLNVENIFGERYFVYAHNNSNITPGAPITAKLALNARF